MVGSNNWETDFVKEQLFQYMAWLFIDSHHLVLKRTWSPQQWWSITPPNNCCCMWVSLYLCLVESEYKPSLKWLFGLKIQQLNLFLLFHNCFPPSSYWRSIFQDNCVSFVQWTASTFIHSLLVQQRPLKKVTVQHNHTRSRYIFYQHRWS